MTSERKKYLQSISFGERITRNCIAVYKDKIKREKRYLNEHKVKPLSGAFDPIRSKSCLRRYKQILVKAKRQLRADTKNE